MVLLPQSQRVHGSNPFLRGIYLFSLCLCELSLHTLVSTHSVSGRNTNIIVILLLQLQLQNSRDQENHTQHFESCRISLRLEQVLCVCTPSPKGGVEKTKTAYFSSYFTLSAGGLPCK